MSNYFISLVTFSVVSVLNFIKAVKCKIISHYDFSLHFLDEWCYQPFEYLLLQSVSSTYSILNLFGGLFNNDLYVFLKYILNTSLLY